MNHQIKIVVEDSEIIEQHRLQTKKRLSAFWILLIIWIALYFMTVLVGNIIVLPNAGHASHFIATFSERVADTWNLITHSGDTNQIEMSYCQQLVIGLTGAALASCGAVFQGSFRNVLAGPSTMGVMSGGSMGAMVYLLFFFKSGVVNVQTSIQSNEPITGFIHTYLQQFCVLGGCFGGVLLILSVTLLVGKGKVSSSAMVIAGTVFSGVISNFLMVIQYWMIARDPSDVRVEIIKDLMMGSFENAGSFQVLLMMGIPILFFLILLVSQSGKINLLSFGEEEAETMGLSVRTYKNLVIIAGTVLTAIVVSFCGRIGFVGFMIPLVVRKLTGPDLHKLLPVCIPSGAIYMTIVYYIAAKFNLLGSISVVTSSIGCAVMLITLFRKGENRYAVK